MLTPMLTASTFSSIVDGIILESVDEEDSMRASSKIVYLSE